MRSSTAGQARDRSQRAAGANRRTFAAAGLPAGQRRAGRRPPRRPRLGAGGAAGESPGHGERSRPGVARSPSGSLARPRCGRRRRRRRPARRAHASPAQTARSATARRRAPRCRSRRRPCRRPARRRPCRRREPPMLRRRRPISSLALTGRAPGRLVDAQRRPRACRRRRRPRRRPGPVLQSAPDVEREGRTSPPPTPRRGARRTRRRRRPWRWPRCGTAAPASWARLACSSSFSAVLSRSSRSWTRPGRSSGWVLSMSVSCRDDVALAGEVLEALDADERLDAAVAGARPRTRPVTTTVPIWDGALDVGAAAELARPRAADLDDPHMSSPYVSPNRASAPTPWPPGAA